MKLNFRRLLAMFLSIVMVAGMLPAAVFAEDGVETQSETNVAQVNGTKYTDLHEAMVACKAGETVLLIANVDLAGTEWEPVSFKGTFDGQNYTISNLTINKPGVSNTGFITSLNGTFKNVTFTNPTVTGGENTGVVAGRAGGSSALAENITVNGTIKVESTHSGYARTAVIVGGWAYGNYKNITVDGGNKANSYVKHTGGGDGRYVAGIVGHADDVESYVNCTVKNITIEGGWLCGAIAGPGPSDDLASGCTVEDVNINADYSGGMFGWYYGNGTIKNATIKNVTFTGGSTNNGAIGGYSANPDAIVTNVTIENVKNLNGAPLIGEVAKIGDTTYTSLQAAINAAQTGDEIIIHTAGSYEVPTGKDITITGAVAGVKFDNIGACNMGGANVTFNNVTFNYAENSTYKGLQHSGNLVYNNCTFNGQVFLYGASETFKDCTFNTTDSDNYNVWTYGAKKVAFNGCAFNSAGKSVLIYSEDANLYNTVTVTDCTFKASQAVEGKAAIEMDSSSTAGISLTIDDTTVESFGTGNVSGNSLWNNKKGSEGDNNDITVVVDGVTVLKPIVPVAKVGNTIYASLQDALDAAKDNTEIVVDLVDDATLDITAWQTLAIGGDTTKTITINGNGKTLTFNKLNSDWNNIATNNDAKLILNNMTITDSGYNNGPWNRYDLNFACDVELDNVTATKALAFKADAVLNTVTINESGDNYAIWIQPNGQTVTIDGLIVTSAGRGIKIDDQYVDNAAKVNLSVANAVFTTAKKAAILVKTPAGADINLSKVDISGVAADTVNAVWNDEDNADYRSLITVNGGTIAQEGATPVYVAKIEGGASFTSLEDAVAAAKSGDTIIILQSGSYEMPKFQNKELTFVGVDKKSTSINDWVEKSSQGMSGSTVHFKNLTINGQTANYYGLFHTAGVTYEGCDINGIRFLYSPTTFTDCAFNANGVEHSFWTYGASKVTVTNCTFTYTDRAVNCYSDQADQATEITFDNCTFIYAGTKDAPEGAVEINSGLMTSIDLTMDNCIAPTKGEMWFNSRWDSKNGANTTVTVDDTQVWPVVVNVAKIGDKKYTSLQAAIDKAQTGDTITLLTDINLADCELQVLDSSYDTYFLVEDKSVTIDLNEKTISGAYTGTNTMLVGVFSTDNGGHLTLTGNGTVNVTATNKVYSLIANYEDGCTITIENGTYKLDKASDNLIYYGGATDAAVTVKDGTFTLGNVGTGENGKPWIFNVLGSGDHYVLINGGTFNANIQRQHWTTEVKVPVSHYMSKNSDDTWTVKEGSAVSVKEGTLYGPYYVSDFEVGYPSLQAFLDAANANVPKTIDSYDPITLLKDCSENININIVLNESEENNERTLTLNLNGYKYSGTITLCHKDNVLISGEGLNVVSGVEGYIVQYADGEYTLAEDYVAWVKAELLAGKNVTLHRDIVVDGSYITSEPHAVNGNGKYPNYGIFTVLGNHDVTIDLNGYDVTYNGHANFEWNGKTYSSCEVAHGLFFANGGANLTIKDSKGTSEITVYGLASGAYVATPNTTITIEGGTWKNYGCKECGGTNIFLYPLQGGELYIKGGYFEQALDSDGKSYLIVEHGGAYANSVIDYSKTKVVISGGTFVGMNPAEIKKFNQTADNKLDMTTEPTTNGCADGYVPVENEDGTWTVEEYSIMVTYPVGNPVYPDGKVEYYNDMREAVPHSTNTPRLEGATITLLKDMSGLGMRLMENGMVFDLNGHTYTLTGGTGSQGTETSGFQIRPEVTETATIKNGTIKIAEGANICWMFNNYATNFIVEDVTVDCTNMAWNYGENCYIHVSRPGDNTNFTGTTNFIGFKSEVAGAAINVGGTMTIANTVNIGNLAVDLDAGATLTAPEGLTVTTNVANGMIKYVDGTYKVVKAVAKIGETGYETFAAALDAVQDGDTITLLEVEGSEISKEIDFTKNIEFTITGTAPKYALPVVTFQNATVNIKNATILIPELDARQNATINVIDSTVYDAGDDSIVKSYYNGAINISGTSVVYTMQVTTMGYITVSDTASLTATWQTNVYGNGMITVEDSATFNTAALQLTGKDYSGRDNTDADRVGKSAQITVDGATLIVGKAISDGGADYSYNSGHGINIGTIAGKKAVLDIVNGAKVNIYMADGETANIGADGTVNVNGELTVGCRDANGTATLVNNGSIVLTDATSVVTANECGNVTTSVADYEVKYADGKYTVVEEVGTIKATEATLLYNEIIQMRFIFALTGDAESNGILVFKDKSDADNHEISKAAQNRSLEFKSGKYYGYTDGIPAKEMGDTVYIVGYLKFADGTYAFSQTVPYSPLIYAERMMTKGTEETKALCKALMHYGAAAQTFMNYNTSNLMNANFEEVPFDISVLGNEQFSYQSGNVNGFTIKEANMLFEGAISYRFKYQIDSSLEGKALYMEYVVKGVTKTVELKAIGDFYYGYAADNAAKDMDELIIAKPFYYNENNEKVYGGSITYSGYEYARRMTNSSTATAAGKALAQAFAMYINAANTAIK